MKMNSRGFQWIGSRHAKGFSAVALLALVVGCNRDEIKVYRVGKEPAPPKVNAPEGWTPVPPGQMRVAAFAVKSADGKQADVSVIPLPGAAGGVMANVNRWRGQVGLQPATEDEIKKSAEPIQVSGRSADLYDLAGKNAASGETIRILAAIQNRDGMAWFFKMTGDDHLVAQQKATFISYLKTFDASVASGPSMLPESHPPIDSGALPPGHPEVSMTPATGGEISREGQPKWEVPSGWKEVPGGQFLVAKFMIGGDMGMQAVVNVSTSSGDGGGLAGNINRWRGQLGLDALSDDEVSKSVKSFGTSGSTASSVEISGTDPNSGQPAKVVSAIVPQSGQTWFYKMMGDPKLVETHKSEFMKFVESVKY